MKPTHCNHYSHGPIKMRKIINYVFDSVKNVTDGAGQNTWDVLRTKHGIGLARSSLSIHKNCTIISLKSSFSDWSNNRLINLRSLAIRAEDIIKLEALCLNSILISSSKLLFSYESINVDLMRRLSGLNLIHNDCHGI